MTKYTTLFLRRAWVAWIVSSFLGAVFVPRLAWWNYSVTGGIGSEIRLYTCGWPLPMATRVDHILRHFSKPSLVEQDQEIKFVPSGMAVNVLLLIAAITACWATLRQSTREKMATSRFTLRQVFAATTLLCLAIGIAMWMPVLQSFALTKCNLPLWVLVGLTGHKTPLWMLMELCAAISQATLLGGMALTNKIKRGFVALLRPAVP